MRKTILFILLFISCGVGSCMSESGRAKKANIGLGTKKNPIKMYFVPSLEAGKVLGSANAIAQELEKATGYYFEVAVPISYAAVIEAIGSYQCDVAWLPTFAYIITEKKYDAKVKFSTVRNGLKHYRGQFVARSDSSITKLEDIQGKNIAYTDAASTSGYIYPSAILKQKGIVPSTYKYYGSHNAAILAVYSGTADVACSYWSPNDPVTGKPKDAREKLLETTPDILEKVVPFAFTDWIPNDTVTFRKNLPKDLEAKLEKALKVFADSPEGKKIMQALYDIDGLEPATDKDYDIVRETLKVLGSDPMELLK